MGRGKKSGDFPTPPHSLSDTVTWGGGGAGLKDSIRASGAQDGNQSSSSAQQWDLGEGSYAAGGGGGTWCGRGGLKGRRGDTEPGGL